MNKIILVILLFFSSTVFSQTKITAKYKKDIADSIAQTYASDALLLLVRSSEVDSNGLSIHWQYVYVSPSEDKEYHFAVSTDTIQFKETTPMRTGLAVIRIDWVDSDSTLEVIKNSGGREIISDHPSCTIEASLIRYLAPPFDTYWKVDFVINEIKYTFHQNAETGEIYTSIMDKEEIINNNFVIYQNYPNPFNSTSIIEFELPHSEIVNLELYNLLGEKVKEIYSGSLNPGKHRMEIHGGDLSTGIYFYIIRTTKNYSSKKCLLLK